MKANYAHIVPFLTQLTNNLHRVFTEEIIGEACEQNPWFTHSDIEFALEAIKEQFLDIDKVVDWLDSHSITPHTEPKKVGVICAGNIPLAGFFDTLCVLAAGHICLVKPSSKDTPLMMALCSFLQCCGAPIELLHDNQEPDAVIASGSDMAMSAIGSTYGSIPTLLRGHRSSVAVLNGNETEEEILELGEDMFRYNSLGCRNITLLWLPEGYDLERFVLTLQPKRDIVSPKYVGGYRQAKATAILTGESVVDGGFFLLQHSPTFPTRLAQVNIATYRTTSEVEEWLSANDTHIQCVAISAHTPLSHPRSAIFGQAQRPTLNDWPDGVDTLEWLNRQTETKP
ncbi:MAG: aldehyde dehydrogenase [Tidjanibacter sp.]|nr:aldehyde dehydrogenase [Tidjanibacter sp.]